MYELRELFGDLFFYAQNSLSYSRHLPIGDIRVFSQVKVAQEKLDF